MKPVFGIIFSLLVFSSFVFSQADTIRTQEEWEAVRDKFATDAILMLARIDTLDLEIDSLKKLNDYTENFDCEAELYRLVGATKEQVSDFRAKFNAAEIKINNRSGTPDDAAVSYFNEISRSKIRCLPEFSERYIAMESGFESWKNSFQYVKAIDTLYTVAQGDYLKRISAEVYGSSKYWELIWDANKEKIYNADKFKENYKKSISNPDRIFPGQVLRIPAKPKE